MRRHRPKPLASLLRNSWDEYVMSAFREALRSGGHGEWIVETFTASGEVTLRKVEERTIDARLVTPAAGDDRIVLKAAA
jgi:hypothetical protein